MDDDLLVGDLAASCRGRVAARAPLAPLTTLRVGGAARVLVEASDEHDLITVGRVAKQHRAPVLVIGRGSNLLVSDAGWDGVAVTLGRDFRGVTIDGTHVRARAAEPLPVLAAHVAEAGLGGFAFAAAIPGGLGGAVRMNAGAHGCELADVLLHAEVVRLGSGTTERWTRERLRMRYRATDLPADAVITGATLALEPVDAGLARAAIAEVRAWRRANQPVSTPSCGSVFVNPSGESAGALIDSAGGKGLAVGRARVSEVHANFIVTSPGATAADVAALIAQVRRLVLDHHGIELETEVVMVGGPSAEEGS